MGAISEFRTFIQRGNVLDLAVGIVIGGAFGKIVSSFVENVLMPPIGLLIGNQSFSKFSLVLKDAVLDNQGKETSSAVVLKYGEFIQATVDFLIIGFAVFLIVKAVNKIHRKKEEEAPKPDPAPTEVLLAEIRDLLKK